MLTNARCAVRDAVHCTAYTAHHHGLWPSYIALALAYYWSVVIYSYATEDEYVSAFTINPRDVRSLVGPWM